MNRNFTSCRIEDVFPPKISVGYLSIAECGLLQQVETLWHIWSSPSGYRRAVILVPQGVFDRFYQKAVFRAEGRFKTIAERLKALIGRLF